MRDEGRTGEEEAGSRPVAKGAPARGGLLVQAPPAVRKFPIREGSGSKMKTYMCVICGWIYSEAEGLPEEGIAPGTKWEDVPPNWVCPDCGARKEDFEMVEI